MESIDGRCCWKLIADSRLSLIKNVEFLHPVDVVMISVVASVVIHAHFFSALIEAAAAVAEERRTWFRRYE